MHLMLRKDGVFLYMEVGGRPVVFSLRFSLIYSILINCNNMNRIKFMILFLYCFGLLCRTCGTVRYAIGNLVVVLVCRLENIETFYCCFLSK